MHPQRPDKPTANIEPTTPAALGSQGASCSHKLVTRCHRCALLAIPSCGLWHWCNRKSPQKSLSPNRFKLGPIPLLPQHLLCPDPWRSQTIGWARYPQVSREPLICTLSLLTQLPALHEKFITTLDTDISHTSKRVNTKYRLSKVPTGEQGTTNLHLVATHSIASPPQKIRRYTWYQHQSHISKGQ